MDKPSVALLLGQFAFVAALVVAGETSLFPVYFNTSQIPIGENLTVVCPISAGQSYHVCCYGGWLQTIPEPKTDDNIYVYNPSGELEHSHRGSWTSRALRHDC